MSKIPKSMVLFIRRGLTPAVWVCLGLSVLGCLAVFNATFHLENPYGFVGSHIVWLLPASVVLIVTAALPEAWLRPVGMVGALFFYMMLVAVLFFGFGVNGMRGWFAWGGVLIQPGELAKPFFVLSLAMVLQWTRQYRDDWVAGFLPPFLFLLAWILPLILQPDLGAALIYVFTFALVFFCMGGWLRHLLAGLVAVLPLFALALRFGPLLGSRMDEAANHSRIAESADWHVTQFQHALASGGVFGRAMGRGVELRYALPPGHSSSIFATLGEAMGLLGLASLLLILMAWVVYGYQRGRTAAHNGHEFQAAAILGMIAILAVQTCLHLSTNIGLLPPLDIKLPLLSYGGGSMLAVFIAVGLVESLSRASQSRALAPLATKFMN